MGYLSETVEIVFRCVCDGCGRELSSDESEHRGVHTVSVEVCPDCLDKVKEAADGAAYERGLIEGRDEANSVRDIRGPR